MGFQGIINNKKKVAIIGAGPAGLCSSKSAIENELFPTVFEKSDTIGGCWSPKSGKMWDTLTTNTSKYLMSFSDYLFNECNCSPEDEGIFISCKSYYKYLSDYSNKFDIIKHIKFNVIKVERINNNESIKITWLDGSMNMGNQVKEDTFDYLIIASGMFSKAQECSFINNELKEFTGKITHSQHYKRAEGYKEKNIVVVGTAISGCEIAADISKVTNKCIQVGHENLYVYSKHLQNENGKLVPWDTVLNNRVNVYTNLNLPSDEFNELKKKTMERYCPKQIKEITQNSKIPVRGNFNTFDLVISSTYIGKVYDGSITVYSGNNFKIISSSGNSITFSNDIGETYTQDNIDEIILCTGYQCDLSYLDKSIQNEISYNPHDRTQPVVLYKNIFSPNLKNIAFVSFFRGLSTATSELLSRWACLVFSGKLKLPIEKKFKYGTRQRNDPRYKNIGLPQFIGATVSYNCDLIAAEIGCLPNFEQLKIQDPELYDMIWNGYFNGSSYRLVGPGAKPDIAKNIIVKLHTIYKQYQ